MTSFIAVSLAALFAAGLTMYSGFGLGTLLLPVFALFFPAEVAVVATAMVHGANNVFKVSLLGRHADREVVLKFGLPAIAAAVLGALALGWLAQSDSGLTIHVNEEVLSEITPVKLLIGLLMIGFALFELLPRFRKLEFERRYLPLGG
ncbi:MAG: TSUP family transporter, partial [Gammaproteobacteria bacterium]|nr:TSUP family transporter [Gammaproteobacteria bacterium]